MNATPDTRTQPPALASLDEQPNADLPTLTDTQAHAIYTYAYNLSQAGQYEWARDLFVVLNTACPDVPEYALAAAICLRKLGQYEFAISLFAQTLLLDPDDDGPAFQLVECMLVLGRRDEALDILETLAEAADERGDTATVEEALERMKLIETTEP